MPTIQQFAARAIRSSAENLSRSASAMPPERQNWRPLEAGRSAFDQALECASASFFFARLLQERAAPPLDPSAFERFRAEHDTMEKTLAALKEGTERLTTVVEAFPEERLADTVTLPFGEGMTMPFSEALFLAYWNNVYHLGQINYIQTLYGDQEMH